MALVEIYAYIARGLYSNRFTLSGDLPIVMETTHEHFDVVIIGAGLSGIAAAYHLRHQCPGKTFVILDAHPDFGGTWHIHRYPGARSDSDLYTFGFRFKPWTGNPIANRDQILGYIGEVIQENNLNDHIRYCHHVSEASWDSGKNEWRLTTENRASGEVRSFTTNFLWMCQGYYRHTEGYTPKWEGMSSFKGHIVHPQHWPEDLAYQGKRVIVIGSGATAATLIPAMARECAHVTMLQRSPAYFTSGRNSNELVEELRRLGIDDSWIHEIARRKVIHDRAALTEQAVLDPEKVRENLLAGVRASLGPNFDVDTHFTPSYLPLQQRVAFVPDGDLFQVIREGHASVVTDEIECFTESGVMLKSGKTIDADIVITATGFNLNALGDIKFRVDGKPIAYSETTAYRGMMLTGMPNMVLVMGYGRYSWTLRADLIGDFVCRLLQHMQKKNVYQVSLVNREHEDLDAAALASKAPKFNPGYLLRNIHIFPRPSKHQDWQRNEDFLVESAEFPKIDLDGPNFSYA